MPTKKTFIDKLGDFFTYIIGVTEYLGDTAKNLKSDLLKERGKLSAQSVITKTKTETILKFIASQNTISKQINSFTQKKDNPVGTDNEIIENAKDYGLKVVSGGEAMPPKLKYGQGTICKRTRQNKNGAYVYWQGRFYEDGTQKTVTAKTLKECIAKMNIKKPVLRTKPQDTANGFMTLKEWLIKWYQKYKLPNIKPTTALNMSAYIQKQIIPALGNTYLNSLTTLQIQEFITGIEKSNTRKKVYDILNGSLRKAYETRIIDFNPAVAVEFKINKSKKKRAYEFIEQEQMLEILSPKYKALFFFLCCTGLRIGEFLALTENDVNKERHTITINKSLGSHTKELGTTKTEETREVHYLDELFETVKTFLRGDKFFGSYTYDGIKKAFGTAITKLGLKNIAVIHSTRHTFSSVCYFMGVKDKQIQTWMGHATLAMTLDTYTHLVETGESIIKDYIKRLKNSRE